LLHWLNITGLFFDLFGAIVLLYGLILSKKDAITLGISRACSEREEDNLKLPAVADFLKQSRNAIIGCVLLCIGFVMQIIASWPA